MQNVMMLQPLPTGLTGKLQAGFTWMLELLKLASHPGG